MLSFKLLCVYTVDFRDDVQTEKMRRTVGCTKLPHLQPASAASAGDENFTRSIAGQWRHLANQFKLYFGSRAID